VFDSTGVAIEDAIVAALVYEKACASKRDTYFAFAV
jgi:ornithine cyclodeaminase/alanine dehydrogenase-like protein (mu-crystallin family)